MLPSRFLLRGICLLVLVSVVVTADADQPRCAAPFPTVYSAVRVLEMSTENELFSMFVPYSSVTVTASVRPLVGTWDVDHTHYFAIKKEGIFWCLYIVKPIKLRILFEQTHTNACGLGMQVTFRCYLGPDIYTTQAKRKIYIRPSRSEFTVKAEATTLNIREDVDPKTWYISLKTLISTPNSSIAMSEFTANPYIRNPADARAFLFVARNGDVRIHKALDSEAGHTLHYLNTTLTVSLFICKGESTVQVGPVQSITGIMTVNIINVNDNPPRFLRDGCPPSCAPPKYITEVQPTFTGPLKNIQDGPIRAFDPDGDEIKFSIINGSHQSYGLYFSISPISGVVTVNQRMDNLAVDFFNLTILAATSSILPETTLTKPNDTVSTFLIVFIEDINAEKMLDLQSSSSLPALPCIFGTVCMIIAVSLM